MTFVLSLKDITLQDTSQLILEVINQFGGKWARGRESGGIDVAMAARIHRDLAWANNKFGEVGG